MKIRCLGKQLQEEKGKKDGGGTYLKQILKQEHSGQNIHNYAITVTADCWSEFPKTDFLNYTFYTLFPTHAIIRAALTNMHLAYGKFSFVGCAKQLRSMSGR